MKRFISTFVAAMMLVASMATTVFAADYALTLSADVDTAKAGEFVKVLTTLDTNVGIKAMQFSITFDPTVFALADDPAAVEDADEYIPGNTQVPYEYWLEYGDVKSAKKWGDATIGAEARGDDMTLTFAYAKNKAVTSANEEMLVGGAYLKVIGEEATTANITLTSVIIGDETGARKEVETNTLAIEITADAPAPTTANVTVADNANALVEVSTTGEVAIGTEITVSVKPMAGFEIVDAFDDALLGMGGEITFAVTEDIEIAVTAAEDDAKPAVVAIAFVEDFGASDCVTFFGKAPAAAAEFGIDIGATFFNEAQAKEYGPKLAAKSMSAAGFYGVKIHNLPEGEYNVSAYADAATSAAFAFAK